MTFIRKIKKKSGTYLAEVESYRQGGKVKQRVIKYLGKDINGIISRRTSTAEISLRNVKQSLDILCIDKIADELRLKSIKDKNVLVLVYSQLLEKRSINKLEEWLRFTEIPEVLGLKNISTVKLYNALTSLSNLEFKKVEDDLSEFFRSKEESNNTAIIDVTDTYFEGSSINVKPRRGKDGKIKRLMQFALTVTLENGFPLFYKKYPGNLSGIQIFKDMNLELKEKGLDSVILDRGMTSEENLKIILNLKMKAIAGLRNNPNITKNFISTVERDDIFSPENRVKLKTTSVYIKPFDYMNGKLIVVYNPQLEILKKEHAFDNDIFDKEKKYGYSLIYHNTSLKDRDVVRKYYEKDTVERAFKQLKGILSLRPVRVWLNEHIEGHFRICFLAYAILSYMDFKLKKLGISAVEALNSLKYGYKVGLKDSLNGHEWDLWVPLEPKQKKIIETIGVVYKNQ